MNTWINTQFEGQYDVECQTMTQETPVQIPTQQSNSLGDPRPVTVSQPDLPPRVVVWGENRRTAIHWEVDSSLEEKQAK